MSKPAPVALPALNLGVLGEAAKGEQLYEDHLGVWGVEREQEEKQRQRELEEEMTRCREKQRLQRDEGCADDAVINRSLQGAELKPQSGATNPPASLD